MNFSFCIGRPYRTKWGDFAYFRRQKIFRVKVFHITNAEPQFGHTPTATVKSRFCEIIYRHADGVYSLEIRTRRKVSWGYRFLTRMNQK